MGLGGELWNEEMRCISCGNMEQQVISTVASVTTWVMEKRLV